MTSLIAWLLGLASAVVAADLWFFHRSALFPSWLPTLLSLLGLIVAATVYFIRKKRKKSKKFRRAPLTALVACLIICLCTTGYWLYQMLASLR